MIREEKLIKKGQVETNGIRMALRRILAGGEKRGLAARSLRRNHFVGYDTGYGKGPFSIIRGSLTRATQSCRYSRRLVVKQEDGEMTVLWEINWRRPKGAGVSS